MITLCYKCSKVCRLLKQTPTCLKDVEQKFYSPILSLCFFEKITLCRKDHFYIIRTVA